MAKHHYRLASICRTPHARPLLLLVSTLSLQYLPSPFPTFLLHRTRQSNTVTREAILAEPRRTSPNLTRTNIRVRESQLSIARTQYCILSIHTHLFYGSQGSSASRIPSYLQSSTSHSKRTTRFSPYISKSARSRPSTFS